MNSFIRLVTSSIMYVTLPLMALHGEDQEHTATPVDPLVLNNDSVWELARDQAFAVQAAREDLSASMSSKQANLSPFRPQLTGTLDWRRNGERPLSGERHRYNGAVVLEQQLLTFGRRYYTRQLSNANIEFAEANLLSRERDAALQALTALESYRFAVATVIVAKARLEQRRGELADAEELFEVGNVPMLDVRETRINLNRAQDGLTLSEANVVTARANLFNTLALTSDVKVTIDEKLVRPEDFTKLTENAEAAVDDNADQRALEQRQQADMVRAKSELVTSLPTLNGNLGYSQAGRRMNDLEDDWYVGVSLNWKLIDGGGRYARRNAFLANARSTESQIDALRADRLREIAIIQADVAALGARIALQKTIIEDSELNYEDARALYQSGEITLTRVGEAGLDLSEAQFNLNNYIFEESVLAHRLRALSE